MNTNTLNELRSQFDEAIAVVARAVADANRHVVALVAKWDKDDLVPGLSDLDLRVICDNDATADDWIEIDRASGHIHLEMVRTNPAWNRVNEHTPGAGMTIAEAMDPRFHNPEYTVWSLWWGETEWFDDFKETVSARTFGATDEYFHLTKFVDYYSPYIHGIDPPINLGPYESKYAVHSRCWHYFAPPILSAASILARRNFTGKREGLTWLRDNGFAVEQVDAVFEQIGSHYETPEHTDPARLRAFEEMLFAGFNELYPLLLSSLQHIEVAPSVTRDELKTQLATVTVDPFVTLMECARFARIRAGRYYFYLNAPDHFDSSRLLLSELFWIQKLCGPVFASMAKLLGDNTLSPETCLTRLGIRMGETERRAFEHVSDLATRSRDDAAVPGLFRQAIDLFPHYYRMIEQALRRVVSRVPEPHLKAFRAAEATAKTE